MEDEMVEAGREEEGAAAGCYQRLRLVINCWRQG
jgi:hypothetical protein